MRRIPCENMCLQFKIYVATTNIISSSIENGDDDDEKPNRNGKEEKARELDNATKTRAPNLTLFVFYVVVIGVVYPKSESVFHVEFCFVLHNHLHHAIAITFFEMVSVKSESLARTFDKFHTQTYKPQKILYSRSLIELELLMVNLEKTRLFYMLHVRIYRVSLMWVHFQMACICHKKCNTLRYLERISARIHTLHSFQSTNFRLLKHAKVLAR